MTIAREDIEAVRQRILEAAGERFQQYGFGKTTMAEIAGDCGMSAANLYRYFENKHDIGAAMASQCLGQKTAMLEEIVRDESLAPTDKMETFILANLRHTHAEWADRPRVNELVDAVCQQRTDIVDEYVRTMRAMFRRIVEEGIATGEFAPCDPEETAQSLKAATFMFDFPGAMNLCSLAEFEHMAMGVARLVLDGLKKR